MTDDFKQEIISEIALQLLPTVYDNTYPYMNNCLAYKYAYAIHDNGSEITNVE